MCPSSRGLFLNFGAGPNQLPEPWQNLDPTHDIRKRLRFENGSVAAILAEHVIEHVPFLQVLGFFQECLRVLEPGGMLRIAFPDIGRFLTSRSHDFALNEDADFVRPRPQSADRAPGGSAGQNARGALATAGRLGTSDGVDRTKRGRRLACRRFLPRVPSRIRSRRVPQRRWAPP